MNAKKILVVDDEASIREMFEMAFSRKGYSVGSAATGEEALEILAHEDFPVMYIDLGLETMSGFDLCERIRENDSRAIIYAVTGYAGILGPEEILEAGFNDYFSKPLDFDVLLKSAAAAFEKIDRSAKDSCPIVVKRILIIDDDESFRKMLRHMLESQGFEVMEACDGEAGIRRQSACPADLIISDIVMPKKEGIETVLTIKEQYPDVKIIVVSGFGWYGNEAEIDLARAMGARTLKKPFKHKELLAIIEQLCRPEFLESTGNIRGF
jgi:DNA-binding response OmpR family regulator